MDIRKRGSLKSHYIVRLRNFGIQSLNKEPLWLGTRSRNNVIPPSKARMLLRSVMSADCSEKKTLMKTCVGFLEGDILLLSIVHELAWNPGKIECISKRPELERIVLLAPS